MDDEEMVYFRKYGFFDALHKPYQMQDLEKSLEGIGDAAEDRSVRKS